MSDVPRVKWRWDQRAAVVVLVLAAALAGGRPGVLRQLRDGAAIALLSARSDPVAWERLRAYRADDPAFQGVVLAQLLDAYARTGDAARLGVLVDRLPTQPAFVAGQPPLMLSYGNLLLANGRADEAATVLEAGLRRASLSDSQLVGLRSALARAYDRQGKVDAAEQLLLSLRDSGTGTPTLARQLALHYADRGTHLDTARALAEQALRRGRWARLGHRRDVNRARTEARCRDALGWVIARSEQSTDRAKELLLEAAHVLGDQPDPLNLYHLATVCFDRGEDNDALRLINQCLTLDPTLEPAKVLRERIQGSAGHGKVET